MIHYMSAKQLGLGPEALNAFMPTVPVPLKASVSTCW